MISHEISRSCLDSKCFVLIQTIKAVVDQLGLQDGSETGIAWSNW